MKLKVKKLNNRIKCSSVKLFIVIFAALPAAMTPKSPANPCYPNDPDGENTGNLCLSYPPSLVTEQPAWLPIPVQPTWSPIPNRPIDQAPFIQGLGKEAYYGLPLSPTQPGRTIGTTTGYWTGISAVNGETTITDSKGQTFSPGNQ